MEFWRKIQIACGVCAVVSVALSVVAYYQPALINVAVWVWNITLWYFLFICPLPIIERNRRSHQYATAIPLAVPPAIVVPFIIRFRGEEAFTFGVGLLLYTVLYTIIALLVAGWLKTKEKKTK